MKFKGFSEQRGFSRKSVSEITGMKPRLIQYYTDQKIIRPQYENPSGKGTVRYYGPKNLLQLEILRQLVENGISLSTVREIFVMIDTNQVTGEVDGKITDAPLPWLDPEVEFWLYSRVYFVIYNPKKDDMKICYVLMTAPEKMNQKNGQREEFLEKRDVIQLRMGGFQAALILNLSLIWRRLIN